MMKYLIPFFLFVAFLASTSSCNKDQVAIDPVVSDCPDTISFVQTVEPLFQQNCSTSGCHDATSSSAGINLVGYLNINAFAEVSFNAMDHKPGFTAMPFGSPKLADSLIQQFDCWIKQGKQNN